MPDDETPAYEPGHAEVDWDRLNRLRATRAVGPEMPAERDDEPVPGAAVTAAAERVASVLRRDLPQYMPDARLRGIAVDAAYVALEAAAADLRAQGYICMHCRHGNHGRCDDLACWCNAGDHQAADLPGDDKSRLVVADEQAAEGVRLRIHNAAYEAGRAQGAAGERARIREHLRQLVAANAGRDLEDAWAALLVAIRELDLIGGAP